MALSKRERQKAVAMFPIAVAPVAAHLGRMIRLQDQGSESSELQAEIDRCEDKIRDVYREKFGCELGQCGRSKALELTPDDEPVNSQWLDSVIPRTKPQGWHWSRGVVVVKANPWELAIENKSNSVSIKYNPTRGDVRRLCEALGIELKCES